MTLRCAVLDDYQGVATSLADWSSVADRVEVAAFRDHVALLAHLPEFRAESALPFRRGLT